LTGARWGLLAAALVAAPGGASAHSLLLESMPASGATLTAPPRELMLRFNNRIEKSLSRVRLVDGRAADIPLVLATGAEGPADRLSAAIPPLRPGRWRVEWQVLSTDGHVVSGRFEFTLTP
jgi:copper resistance protein C